MSTHPRQTNPLHQYRGGGRTIRHAKDRALTDWEFELLLEGARELKRQAYYYEPDPELTIYTLGRLGLRRGELAHLHESWVDWREEVIRIPAYHPCQMGEDGAVCGDCRQAARQRVEHADGELSFEEALQWMWAPKSEAGARDVYYGHDTRAKLYLERYFRSDAYDRFEPSGTAVSRRVKRAAEAAPELHPEDVHPHGLRATAASNFSTHLDVYALKQVMGWERLATSKAYIARNSDSTAQQLEAANIR